MALTEKQSIFVEEYLVDLNATQAYKRAGYSVKSDKAAATEGSKLLRNPNIQNAIQDKMREREQRTEITQDKVLRELAKLGFMDVRKFFDKQGKPKDITALDDNTAACLVGIDIQDLYEDKGEGKEHVGYVKKYKLADKIKALELLGRHLGMFKDKVELSGLDGEKSKLDDIIKQMRGGDG